MFSGSANDYEMGEVIGKSILQPYWHDPLNQKDIARLWSHVCCPHGNVQAPQPGRGGQSFGI